MDCVLILSVLILLVILFTSSREMYKALENTSYPGMRRKNMFRPADTDPNDPEAVKKECMAQCDDRKKCTGFVQYKSGKCGFITRPIQEGNLKDGEGITATTYLKGKKGIFEPVGYDIKGGNQLEVLEETNIKKCKKICKDKKKCAGLVYDKRTRACVLKKKITKSKDGAMTTILKKVMGQETQEPEYPDEPEEPEEPEESDEPDEPEDN